MGQRVVRYKNLRAAADLTATTVYDNDLTLIDDSVDAEVINR